MTAMPGLLRGIARTAVIAGTATAVSNRVSRRQAGRWATQEEDAYQRETADATPEPDDMSARIEQLRDLAELKAQGILTDAEMEDQKARILQS
jgi:hypothetical protein